MVSWGWAAVLLSSWAHLASTLLFLSEARKERGQREKNEELLLQLQPVPIYTSQQSGRYI